MQGRILGFQGGSGVVQGDDGERYAFSRDDWFSDGEPERATLVDFVADGSQAREIFLALGARKPGADTLKPAPSLNDAAVIGEEIAGRLREASTRDDALGDLLGKVRAAPQMVVALIILFVSFGVTFMSLGYENPQLQQWGVLGMKSELALLEVPGEADQMRTAQEEARERVEQELDAADTMAASAAGRSSYQLEARKRLKDAEKELGKLDNMLLLTNLIWLIPLLAVATMWLGWIRNAAVRPVGTALGVASAAVAVFPYIWERQSIALLEAILSKGDLLNTARRAAQKAFELQAGGWMLIALGGVCIFLGVSNFNRTRETY